MDFMGAADYYFWEGVLKGKMGFKDDLNQGVSDMFTFTNQTSIDCLEAFKWGICLGLIITEDEYISLTTIEKPVNIEAKNKSKVKVIKNRPKRQMIGNC
jgi:hypothetical protein